MRNNLILFFYIATLMCFSLLSKAQFVSIPDANFRAYLEVNFATCMQGGKMDTTCTQVIIFEHMKVSALNISDLTGVQYFDALETLDCDNNQLTFLPKLPVGLKILACPQNYISQLPVVPATLEWLFCQSNQLTVLPALPNTLTLLDCSWNQLISLPTLSQSLIDLFCWENQLTALPPLPVSLSYLRCDFNQLSTLPVLPPSIRTINANHNLLSVLPSLPQGLEELACNDNQLQQIPTLPASLLSLGCSDNQLASLPYLPTGLQVLGCEKNNLSELPYLPETLSRLACRYNQINCLPVLPNALVSLVTDSICRPNQPPNLKTNVPPNYPLCSDLIFTHTRVCAGDSTSFVLKDDGCHAFLWDFDDPVTGANNTSTRPSPKHLFSKPGTFNVKLISYVTDPATVITQVVTVDKLQRIDFGNDHSMCQNDGIILDAGKEFESYLWQDGSTVQAYKVTTAGTYTVTATNACGSETETIHLSDYILTVPNLFTPNKDGLNDIFEIKGLDGDAGSLHVYNSWGAEVYSAERYYNNWNAEELTEGIYYYSFSLKSCPVQKSWLQITR